jgi:dTDP-4-dehydrorhamnose 3,5-epimerase
MKFIETKLKGAFIIEPDKLEDERGFFARTFCRKEFKEHGLDFEIVQCNISFNQKKGTLRGMHYQASPHEEAKLVSCTRGAIFDVILDLRRDSPTAGEWEAFELRDLDNKMIYISKGLAHGFQTLEADTEVFYQMSEFYHPECARGIRWNDPEFGIIWPETQFRIISMKDKSYPDLKYII